jgi:hypothetical protein
MDREHFYNEYKKWAAERDKIADMEEGDEKVNALLEFMSLTCHDILNHLQLANIFLCTLNTYYKRLPINARLSLEGRQEIGSTFSITKNELQQFARHLRIDEMAQILH